MSDVDRAEEFLCIIKNYAVKGLTRDSYDDMEVALEDIISSVNEYFADNYIRN